MARKPRPPITLTIDQFDPKGQSGLDSLGTRWTIKGAPVGSVVQIQKQRKQKGRLLSIEQLPPNARQPLCSLFGVCGGCQLQHMPLDDQRREKSAMLKRLFPFVDDIRDTTGSAKAYGYRNKIELTFGTKNYTLSPDTPTVEGSYLGFHPRGWYSKIVPVENCAIASERMNAVIEHLQSLNLSPAWDEYHHKGTWRHVIIREGEGLLISLVTSPDAQESQVDEVAAGLQALPYVKSVHWIETDAKSKVAQGTVRKVYGTNSLSIRLRDKSFLVPHDGFFQVNTEGMEVLLTCIEEACSNTHTLLDLYCGSGSIGIALSHLFEEVIGIELHENSIEWAKINAANNQVQGTWLAGPVEKVLPTLSFPRNSLILVDPPRVGLHPKAAAFLAAQETERLVYVACSPASLLRDAKILEEGGWKLETLWSVDLFPQTPHVESIALFTKDLS